VKRTAADEGIHLVVRVTPKGGRDGIEGVTRDANGKPMLKVRIAAAALVTLLAEEFDVPKKAVTVVRGAGARVKHVHIRGTSGKLKVRFSAMGETA
jgi:uncharacterized protein YggU (UPF0235/DUF167 family)